jgi:hypothetical protein
MLTDFYPKVHRPQSHFGGKWPYNRDLGEMLCMRIIAHFERQTAVLDLQVWAEPEMFPA